MRHIFFFLNVLHGLLVFLFKVSGSLREFLNHESMAYTNYLKVLKVALNTNPSINYECYSFHKLKGIYTMTVYYLLIVSQFLSQYIHVFEIK